MNCNGQGNVSNLALLISPSVFSSDKYGSLIQQSFLVNFIASGIFVDFPATRTFA
jgi:hypothetical protein